MHSVHESAIRQTLDSVEADDFHEGWDDERGTEFAKEIRAWVRENRPHMSQEEVWEKVKDRLFDLLPEDQRALLVSAKEWDADEIIAEEVLYTVADPGFSDSFHGDQAQTAADLSSKVRASLEGEHDMKQLMAQWKGEIDSLLEAAKS
nr:hypothetical protein [Sicyoidochytrium minutum DNA virus]